MVVVLHAARQAASVADWAHEDQGARGSPRRRGGRNVGGLRKAHSVSTWPTIQDESLRVGGLVDIGWGLQLEGEQGPLWTLVGVRQLVTAAGR